MAPGLARFDALVVGGDGLIGAEIVAALRGFGHAVRATSRRSRTDALALDLAAPELRLRCLARNFGYPAYRLDTTSA